MLGGKEVAQLRLQKQALLIESSVNRQELIAELENVRFSFSRMGNALRTPRRFAPLLMGLVPLVGFFTARGVRRPVSLIGGIAKAAKWIGPAISLWRSFTAARRRDAEQGM